MAVRNVQKARQKRALEAQRDKHLEAQQASKEKLIEVRAKLKAIKGRK